VDDWVGVEEMEKKVQIARKKSQKTHNVSKKVLKKLLKSTRQGIASASAENRPCQT
jgi:predicted DNA-binding protein (UPF0251 family)